jgi:hypothetical protein
MSTAEFFRHYLQAARDKRPVRFGDEGRMDEGEVDSVRVDSDGRRDFVKLTLKVPIPHESGNRA